MSEIFVNYISPHMLFISWSRGKIGLLCHFNPLWCSPLHLDLLPIGVNTKPAETDDEELNKDIDENRCVDIAEVKEDEDYEANDPDDEEGGDPDEGGVDEVVVGSADAYDEEGAGGERDGGHDQAEDALPDVHFSTNLPIFPYIFFPCTIVVCSEMSDEKSREGNVEQVKDQVDDPQRQTACFQRAAAASVEYKFVQHLEALGGHSLCHTGKSSFVEKSSTVQSTYIYVNYLLISRQGNPKGVGILDCSSFTNNSGCVHFCHIQVSFDTINLLIKHLPFDKILALTFSYFLTSLCYFISHGCLFSLF